MPQALRAAYPQNIARLKTVAFGPPAARCKPATFCFAAEIAGPEKREQAIEVEERVPLDLTVSRAEDGLD